MSAIQKIAAEKSSTRKVTSPAISFAFVPLMPKISLSHREKGMKSTIQLCAYGQDSHLYPRSLNLSTESEEWTMEVVGMERYCLDT